MVVNQTVRGRGGTGTGSRPRSVAVAARAAAKRAEKAQGPCAGGVEEARGSGFDEPAAREKRPTRPGAGKAPARTAARRPPKPSRVAGAVLSVLVLLGLVATALLVPEYYGAERTRQARTDALAAAQKAAPVILSYDYRRLDRDFAAASGHLTGSFRSKYRKTTSTVVMPTAKKYRAVVEATVAKPPSGKAPAASVVSASPDRVVVLLFMNQVSKSTQVSGPRLDLNRVRMTLVRVSDKWKVSAVDAL